MTVQFAQGLCIGTEIISAIGAAMLIVAVVSGDNLKKKQNMYFVNMLALLFLTLVLDIPYEFFYGKAYHNFELRFFAGSSYVALIGAIAMFTFYLISLIGEKAYISNNTTYAVMFVLGVTCIIWVESILLDNEWFVSFPQSGYVTYMPARWITIAIPILVIVFDILLAWSCRPVMTFKESIVWVAYPLLPLITLPVSSVFGPGILYSASTVAVLFVYVFEHAEREKELALTQSELANSKMKLMVSQIQPHFMYNSLNSIYYLIEKDPEEAQEAVSAFSDYLRQNVNSLKSDTPVSFEAELSHTDAYLYLEKIRFGERIKIVKNIKSKDFKVPALSVQPLVENAVKHGLSKKSEGGTLTIESFEDEDFYIIKVTDDGTGFNPEAPRQDSPGEKSSHVGIENVAGRIKKMCHGSLDIQSEPGKGTVSTILLPKEAQRSL